MSTNSNQDIMVRKPRRKIYQPHELPTIVIETPSGMKVAVESANSTTNNSQEFKEVDDLVSPLPNNDTVKAKCRKKSISLPNLEELEQLRERIEYEENVIRGDFSSSDDSIGLTSDEDEHEVILAQENIPKRVPLRNVRRKSVTTVPRMLKPSDLEAGYSPGTSITSVNSLASLLKEKIQNLPATLRKRKPKEYKIRAFVGILFITIVFLVGFAYVLYQQKLLQKAYFERIKINKALKEIRIFNGDGHPIIRGNLGTTLTYDKVYPCLRQDLRNDSSICMEWMGRARLYIDLNELSADVRCYNFQWSALTDQVDPTDCFDMSADFWYGGGQTAESAWPLNKAHHDFLPFITGTIENNQWGNVLKRYFINSKGAAIIIEDSTPLYVSVSNNTKTKTKQFCLKAKYDDFAFVNRLTPLPQLNYSVCVASNTTILHSYLTEKALWDGLKPEELKIIDSLLTEPLWEITASSKEEFNEDTLSTYTKKIIDGGFLKQGHVLINEFWQKHIGDFTLDLDRFPDFDKTMEALYRRGFRVIFTIQPYISTESENFADAVRNRTLVSQRVSDRRIPALTRYKSLQSAAVLDVTANNTVPWLLHKLNSIKEKLKFHAYYLDMGTAYDMPHYYKCDESLMNPDHYKTLLINSLQGSVSLFGVNSAVQRPRAPIFVSLPAFESSWSGLRRVIPTVLTYGLIGYPFLIPGAVGGDYESYGFKSNQNITDVNIELPDKELYVRWLQLATFLPVIRFKHLPSNYGDDKVLEMAKVMTSLRQTTVTPLLKSYVQKTLTYGVPLIRPLWMLAPNDPTCHLVADQFAIGDDLIVAPVLHSGAREREVYLPEGHWQDGIDGRMMKGNRWIHDHKVEEHEIAYFVRMTMDNV